MQTTTNSPQETNELAKKIASITEDGDLITLVGNLGTGKTTFTQGLCQYLKVTGEVTSPTFTLINNYNGEKVIHHIDLYRLDHIEDTYGIGIEEYLPPYHGITLVEWADKFPEVLPDEYISINISYGKKNQRTFNIEGIGKKYEDFERKLSELIQ